MAAPALLALLCWAAAAATVGHSAAAAVELPALSGVLELNATAYTNNSDVFWRVPSAPAGSTFVLRFSLLSVEPAPQCAYDFVGVALAAAPTAPLGNRSDEFVRVCGQATTDGDVYRDASGVSRPLGTPLRTAWNGAVVWFHTDADRTFAGFRVAYNVSAPVTLLRGPQPLPDQWVVADAPFAIALAPAAYFRNALVDDPPLLLTVEYQSTPQQPAEPLPFWAAYNATTNVLASPNATLVPDTPGNYTFVVTARNSLGAAARVTFQVVVVVAAPYDDTSTIACTDLGAVHDCVATPRRNGTAVHTNPSLLPVIVSGGGSLTVTTPATNGADRPYTADVRFLFYPPASGGVTVIRDSRLGITPTVITAKVVPDSTSSLVCWPTYAPPGSPVKCEYTPRRNGVAVYADLTLLPPIIRPTVNVPGGDAMTVPAFPTADGTKWSFTATVGSRSATYTMRVTGSTGAAGLVQIASFVPPDESSLLACSAAVTVTNRPVTCTLVPRVKSQPIVAVSTYFTASVGTPFTANASYPYVVYANVTTGEPVIVCVNTTAPNVTTTIVRNETAYHLPPPYNYTEFVAVNTTDGVLNVTVCGPLTRFFVEPATSYPRDNATLVSPLTPYSGVNFTFTVTPTQPGLRVVSVANNATSYLNRTRLLVVAGPDNSSTLTCDATVPVGSPLTCALVAVVNGTVKPVVYAAYAPTVTATGSGGAATVSALTPIKYPATTDPATGLPAASHFQFTVTPSASGVYVVTDGVTSRVARVTAVTTPDTNSSLVCAATQLVTGAVVTCTFKATVAGVPVYCHTARVVPTVVFTPSIATTSTAPATGTFGPVYSTVASATAGDAASATTFPALAADQTVGSAFSFTYTAPGVSGTAALRVTFVSAVDPTVTLAATQTVVTLAVADVPDATSRIVCPSPRLTVGHAMTCYTFARKAGAAINTDVQLFAHGLSSGTGSASIDATAATSTSVSSGTTLSNVRVDVAPPFDVSIADVVAWGLSSADVPVTAAAASLGGGVDGAPVPITPPYDGPLLTAASAAASGSGVIGPGGVQRVVYFDVTCAQAYETVMVRDGVSPPILLGCQPPANSFSWQRTATHGWHTLGRAIDIPPTAFTPQPVATGARRLTQVRCNGHYCAAVTQAREFVLWRGAAVVGGFAALGSGLAYANAMPWVAVAVLKHQSQNADPNPIYALSATGVVAHLSGTAWQPVLFAPPTLYGIDLLSSTTNGQFMLAANTRTGAVYSWGPASAYTLLGRTVGAGVDPLVPAQIAVDDPYAGAAGVSALGPITHLFAYSYGVIVHNRTALATWGAQLANTVLPSESFPSRLNPAMPPVRGSTLTDEWSRAGGIVDVQGNDYALFVLTGSGALYGLSLALLDRSAFQGLQQTPGSTTGVAAQQFERITALPTDPLTGQPITAIRQIAVADTQLVFTDATNRVWMVAPAVDSPATAANVFAQFASAGQVLVGNQTVMAVAPFGWLQTMFASATAMPAPSPAQPIATPLALAASTGFVVSFVAPRVHVCASCPGYADTPLACGSAPYQCASLSYALRAFTFAGTTFYLRRGATLLDSGFASAADDLQFVAESDADARFATAISQGNGYTNYNNKFLYPVSSALPTASAGDGGARGWVLRNDQDLLAHTATIDCNGQPCFQLTGKRYTFQGITVRNGVAPAGSGGGGCIALGPYSRLNLWDTHFRLCTSPGGDGGAVAIGPNTQVYVWGSSFVSNSATATAAVPVVGGGAIAQRLTSSTTAARGEGISVVNSYFEANTVQGLGGGGGGSTVSGAGDGGAILALGSNVLLARSTLVGNLAPGRGGAVHADGPLNAYVGLCDVTDNQSGGVGGGASVLNAVGWTLTGSRFARNSAVLLGGGVYNEGSPLAVTATEFDANAAVGGLTASGGALYSIGQQSLGITSCSFVDNLARTLGGALVASNSVPTIVSSVFARNTAASGGGAVFVAQSTVAVRNTSFVANNATTGSGGGVYSQDITSGVLGGAASFSGNAAAVNGGGVAFAGVGLWTVGERVSFDGNAAQSGGGVYWEKTLPSIDTTSNVSVVFAANSAPHGPNLASQAKALVFDAGTVMDLANVTSGAFLRAPLGVTLHDHYNQTTVVDSTAVVTGVGVPPTPDVTFAGTQVVSVVNGRVTLNSAAAPFGVILRPDSVAYFALKATLSDATTLYSATFTADLQECQPGEESLDGKRCLKCALGRFSNESSLAGPMCMNCATGESTAATGLTACSSCAPGRFNALANSTSCATCADGKYQDSRAGTTCTACWPDSFSRDDRSTCDCNALYYLTKPGVCEPCPAGADCTHPATTVANVRALAGFQADVTGTNLRFISCFVEGACGAGGNCTGGYSGNLCSVCPEGRARAATFDCEDCPSHLYSQLITSAAVISVCLAFGLLTYLTRRAKKGTRPAVFARIVLNAMQLNALAIYFRYPWPTGIDVLVEYEQKAVYVGANILSVDCFLRGSYTTAPFYLKTLFFACIPPAGVLLALGLYGVIYSCRRWTLDPNDVRAWFKRNVACMTVIVLFVVHPAITQQTLLLFTCLDLGSSESGAQMYLVGDLSQKCYEGTHLAWMLALGLPMLLLYVVAIPLGLVWEMRRTIHQTAVDLQRELRRWYRWVLDGYSDRYCYWEAVCILRKAVVVLISVQVAYSYESRSLMTLLIVVLSLATHCYCQPFDHIYLNSLEAASLANSFVTFFAGHFYFLPSLNTAQANLLTAIIVICNVLFVVLVIAIYRRTAREGFEAWEKSDIALKKALDQKKKLLAAQTILEGGGNEHTAAALKSRRATAAAAAAAPGVDGKAPDAKSAEAAPNGGGAGGAAAAAPKKAGAGSSARAKSKRGSVLEMLGLTTPKPDPAADTKTADAPAAAEEPPKPLTELDRQIAADEAQEARELAAKKKADAARRKSVASFLAVKVVDPADDDDAPAAKPAGSAGAPAAAPAPASIGADGQPLPPDEIRATGQAADQECVIA